MPRSRPEPISAAVAAGATAASIAGLLGTLYYLDIPSFLNQRVKSRQTGSRLYSADGKQKPSLAAFQLLTQQPTLKETYPLAKDIQKRVPIYDCTNFKLDIEGYVERLQDEWNHILLSGPGVFVLKSFFSPDNLGVIEAANTAYAAIIEREKRESGAKGDHFAGSGANDRIWNSFSKHALLDPESFVKYYSNPLFKLVCEAWLGPAYRLTAQVNVVKPGGKAQTSHRDYHLGFQTAEAVSRWPKAMHNASQLLTLQGAVAHTDMPLDSGPTRLLPFSQMFEEGFMAYRLEEFNQYFLQSYIALPLEKGDAVFFNPALFHAAGENVTKDFSRSANLIQVSSAFGKTMETIDTIPIVEKIWDDVQAKYKNEGWSKEVDALIGATGEGYPFPTNLDRRPPAPGGMAPESEQDLLRSGLEHGWSTEKLVGELRDMHEKSLA